MHHVYYDACYVVYKTKIVKYEQEIDDEYVTKRQLFDSYYNIYFAKDLLGSARS